MCENVVSVSGVLLPKFVSPELEGREKITERGTDLQGNCDRLVSVLSTEANMRSLALAVSKGSPVLLEGPVGSGKTALVEHLARVTGRDRSPLFMKIQLGDQTDSKVWRYCYV